MGSDASRRRSCPPRRVLPNYIYASLRTAKRNPSFALQSGKESTIDPYGLCRLSARKEFAEVRWPYHPFNVLHERPVEISLRWFGLTAFNVSSSVRPTMFCQETSYVPRASCHVPRTTRIKGLEQLVKISGYTANMLTHLSSYKKKAPPVGVGKRLHVSELN
jgi:hypothetical protein